MTNSNQVTIDQKLTDRYKKVVFWTIVTLYVLIMVGGIVRATGAGMGCPDWPRCFGSWVPPTEVSQLPENYQEIYGAKLKGEVIFNPVKTWIEYVNRLFGVFTGLWIIATVVVSIPLRKIGLSSVFNLSVVALIFVLLQGWLGAKVVSSELHPVMITLHMLFAIVIVFILLWAYAKVSHTSNVVVWNTSRSGTNKLLYFVLALSVIQILIGTQVREEMDHVIFRLGYENRDQWMENMELPFWIHRSFSIVVLVANVLLVRSVMKNTTKHVLVSKITNWILISLGIEILLGIILSYFSVPAFAQPTHLTVAVLMLGLQFVLYLFLNSDVVFSKRGEEVLTEGI